MGRNPNTDALGHPGGGGTGAAGRNATPARGGNPGVKKPGNGGTPAASNTNHGQLIGDRDTQNETAKHRASNTNAGTGAQPETARHKAENAGSGKGFVARPGRK